MIIALLCLGGLILIGEAFLWSLFYPKIVDMHFPPALDASSIRFFSIRRIRFAVITHTALLLLSTLIPLWFLW